MDLLRVQDTLKNASDQQLMHMMRSPDSTAPSYLVLSEIRRRSDMRKKQVPDEGSRRTVAEDLTAPESQGIRDMQMPEQASPDMDDQAGIEAMREGGVVRMQAGGQTMGMSASDPVIFGRPLSSYSLEELDRLRTLRTGIPPARRTGRIMPQYIEGYPGNEGLEASSDLIERRRALLATRTETPFPVEGQVNPPFSEAQEPATQPAAPAPGPTVADGQNRPRPAPSEAAPAQPAAQPAQGIGALRAEPVESPQGVSPDIQFTDRLSPLFERMREGRVDPATRRDEAFNMALIEAGLRMAGSRNPNFMGAIGEGALPAVQAYSQQLGQIRTDQRADLRDELQGALAQNQNDYQRGRLSQQEYATEQQMIIERMRQAGLNRRAFMEASRAPERFTYAQYLAMPPEEREIADRYRGRPPARPRGEITEYETARIQLRRAEALMDPGNRSSAGIALAGTGIRNPTTAQIDDWIISRINPAPRTQTGAGGSQPTPGQRPPINLYDR